MTTPSKKATQLVARILESRVTSVAGARDGARQPQPGFPTNRVLASTRLDGLRHHYQLELIAARVLGE